MLCRIILQFRVPLSETNKKKWRIRKKTFLLPLFPSISLEWSFDYFSFPKNQAKWQPDTKKNYLRAKFSFCKNLKFFSLLPLFCSVVLASPSSTLGNSFRSTYFFYRLCFIFFVALTLTLCLNCRLLSISFHDFVHCVLFLFSLVHFSFFTITNGCFISLFCFFSSVVGICAFVSSLKLFIQKSMNETMINKTRYSPALVHCYFHSFPGLSQAILSQ